MRIFQVITVSEYGGAQAIVADLIKNLTPEHEVFVLYGGEGESWSMLGDNFTRIRLEKSRKSVSWRDFILLLKLFYYRLKYKPDVVHLHSSKMGALGRLAFNSKKIVYTVHGFDSVRKAFPQFLKVEKLLKNRAKRIVGVSQYDVDLLKEEGIYKNVIRIYNGIEDYYNEKTDVSEDFSKKLIEIKEVYAKTVMCIARISPQKRFDLFVEMAQVMPQYAFVWIGNKETIDGLPQNVYCLGEIHSAYTYFKYADLFVLPSHYEGLPISLLEALSFGLPSVASAVGGITEVLDGKNGFGVPNDITVFKEKIEFILEDKDRYKMMSKCARQTYITNFTIEKMINGYLSVYEDIVNKKI
jgi:glycosyltransferase involved in cell wall biosynthesis